MSRKRPRSRLAEAMFLLVLLLGAGLMIRETGWLDPREGRFVAVDGDSLRKDEESFRLHAIDAPELHQSCTDATGKDYHCGRQAQAALQKLVSGGSVTCRIVETDRYGRFVAVCRAGDLDINAELVRLGWAIAYRKHGRDYVDEEEDARAAARGIWQGPFETPEAWRAANRRPRTSDLGGREESLEED